jgi:hypothetical protein
MLYELTESGHALKPLLYELARFGLRFMEAPRRGDHSEPDWVRLGWMSSPPRPDAGRAFRSASARARELRIQSRAAREAPVSDSGPAATTARASRGAAWIASGALDPGPR